MPPKKDTGPSKKTVQKQQEKVIEDKTFGLKNKNKSKTVQKFIKGVETQVKKQDQKGGEAKRIAEQQNAKLAEKKQLEKEALLNSLFRSVIAAGGENNRKAEPREDEKIDLYTDQRALINNFDEEEDDNMENWTEEKLKEVAAEKEQKYKVPNKTEKVCMHFLDAVERRKYGWRWLCPNGETCIYKHCLPPGYVLKLPEKRSEPKEERTLEEIVEEDRAKLGTGGTPVTFESFKKWREQKLKRKEIEVEKKRLDEIKKNKGGKGYNVLSGRALFKYDPTLFADDEDAAENKEYEEQEGEEEEEEQEEDNREEEKQEEEDENGDDDDEGDAEEGEDEDEDEEKENEEDQNDRIKVSKSPGKQGKDDEERVIEAKEQTSTGADTNKTKKNKQKKKDEAEVKVNQDLFLDEDDVDLPDM